MRPSEPSRYTVVFRFDETENGSVVIVSGANQNSSTSEYTAPGGSTVTLAPVPDEGYRYKSGSIRVYCRESGSEIYVPVDEDTFSFVVSDVLSCYVNGRSISYQVELFMFFSNRLLTGGIKSANIVSGD